jgi:hypothetical protein
LLFKKFWRFGSETFNDARVHRVRQRGRSTAVLSSSNKGEEKQLRVISRSHFEMEMKEHLNFQVIPTGVAFSHPTLVIPSHDLKTPGVLDK